jgi:hypothetical protein
MSFKCWIGVCQAVKNGKQKASRTHGEEKQTLAGIDNATKDYSWIQIGNCGSEIVSGGYW